MSTHPVQLQVGRAQSFLAKYRRKKERQSKEPTWRQQVCILLVHGLWGEKERKKKKKK